MVAVVAPCQSQTLKCTIEVLAQQLMTPQRRELADSANVCHIAVWACFVQLPLVATIVAYMLITGSYITQ